MALHLYRRHRVSCSQKSQNYRRCQCPIYVKGTLGKAKVRMSMDQTSWDAATKVVGEWVETGRIGQTHDLTTKPLAEAINAFIADATSRGLAAPTLRRYHSDLIKKLLPWAEQSGYSYLNLLSLDALTEFRNSWSLSSLTKQKTQDRLKAFFRWCKVRGWISVDPTIELSSIRSKQKPTLPFEPAEMAAIMTACEVYPAKKEFYRLRLKAFVLMLRWSGLRIGDVVGLEWSRLASGRLLLYVQKTGTPVYLPLPEIALQSIQTLQTGKPRIFWHGTGPVEHGAVTFRQTLRKLFKLANVPNGHAHRFRDTFAVELLLKGVDIADVSVLLGHSSVKVTERHYSPWVKARQSRLEGAVRSTWASDTAS